MPLLCLRVSWWRLEAHHCHQQNVGCIWVLHQWRQTCGSHGMFPAWSSRGTSWTGWVRVSIPDRKPTIVLKNSLSGSAIMSRGGIVTTWHHIGRTLFIFYCSLSFLWLFVVCFVWAGSWAAGFFWLWQTALVYLVPVGGMYCIYNLCFVRLLLFEIACVVRIWEWLPDWV